MVLTILVIIFLSIATCAVCGALVVAGRADDLEEMMFREKTCGNCLYNRRDRESINEDFYCSNEESDYFGFSTEYTDECEEWQQKR